MTEFVWLVLSQPNIGTGVHWPMGDYKMQIADDKACKGVIGVLQKVDRA